MAFMFGTTDSGKTYDLRSAIVAQEEYCEKAQKPHFAPRNGICWHCGRNIYSAISVEEASNTLVTGCPFCHISYCD